MTRNNRLAEADKTQPYLEVRVGEDLLPYMRALREQCPTYDELLEAAAQLWWSFECAEPYAKLHVRSSVGASEGGKKGQESRRRDGAVVDKQEVRNELTRRLQAGGERSVIVTNLANRYGVTGRRINQILNPKKKEA